VADGAPLVTPLHFEERYQGEWNELESALDRLLNRKKAAKNAPPVQGERVAMLYRRACEHLALARARSYPAYLLDQLERLTADAHQVIYQRREFGMEAIRRFLSVDFPRTVRADARYVWLSAALLYIPTLIIGWLVYRRPDLILSVVDARTAAMFDQMYSQSATAVGRAAQGDWVMFGFYIRHNIGIAFKCFAGGIFLRQHHRPSRPIGDAHQAILDDAISSFIAPVGWILVKRGSRPRNEEQLSSRPAAQDRI